SPGVILAAQQPRCSRSPKRCDCWTSTRARCAVGLRTCRARSRTEYRVSGGFRSRRYWSGPVATEADAFTLERQTMLAQLIEAGGPEGKQARETFILENRGLVYSRVFLLIEPLWD